MKVAALLAWSCAAFCIKRITCAAIEAPLDVITLDDLSESERVALEYLDSHYPRPKRSGGDIISYLKSSIGQGIKSKLGQIAKGSASASSHFSSGSSGHGHHYDVPETYDHKSFDFWSLKKSILNTLLQAVKAIKGGVIAIKGQLIKGSGYILSAKGKLISAKGEAITTVGKNIASSAVLSPPYSHHHEDYGHSHDYHHPPSGPPAEEYGSPSAPGPEYEAPEHHHHSHHHEDKPDAEHSGILILKKIPTHDHHGHTEHEDHHHVPDFKPIDHSGPGFGDIVGKFFSASTSLTPGEPAPFTNTAPGHSYHDVHPSSHHEVHPSPSHESHPEHHVPPTSHDSKSPPSGYGGQFEQAPAFLNLDGYTSESKKAPESYPAKEPEKAKYQATTTPRTYDEVRQLPASFSGGGYDNSYVKQAFPQSEESFPPYANSESVKPLDGTSQFGAFQNYDSGTGDIKYAAPPSEQPSMFSNPGYSSYAVPPNTKYDKYNNFEDNMSEAAHKLIVKRPPPPPRTKRPSNPKTPPSYNLVKSIAYELGPNGPKRLKRLTI